MTSASPQTLPFPDVRATDPSTSVGAATINRPRRANHKALVLDALRAAGPSGLTDFETGAATGLQQTSAGKRRLDLQRDGLVRPLIGERRLSPSGTPAQVWVAI